MSEHLVPADLERLVQGTLSAPDKHRVLTHLLRRCPRCCGALARFGGLDATAEVAANEYDGAVERAIARAMQTCGPRYEAITTLAALLGDARSSRHRNLSPAELAALEGLRRLRALIEAARAVRYQDPQGMLGFAKLAKAAAERLRARDHGRQPVADLRALAWAELGSAYRVCDELRLADHAINRAVYWCKRGSLSDLLVARLADLHASLLAYQRRFPEGRRLLRIVYEVHAEEGRRHLAGRALVKLGHFAEWEGVPREAMLLMLRGFRLLDVDRDRQLAVQTAWSMIWVLTELGHFRSARRLLWRGRILFSEVMEPHRVRWLEGRIHDGLGDWGRAERAYQQARAGFSERGQVYPAALVGLDLAYLWTRQHRVKEVYYLAEEMIAAFRALRIAREAVTVLLILKRGCLQGGGDLLGVIGIVMDMVRNLERQPARPYPYSGSPPPPAGSPSSPGSPSRFRPSS
jgi:tetratricopeptide (TPR) repeat protein